MAVNMGTFTAEIEGFAKLTRQKIEAVFKESAQDVFEAAQRPKAQGGNMPVDTGFLRNTFVAESNGFSTGPDAYVMQIAEMELGDALVGGWTAQYARHVEYGTSRMAGSFFALRAAQQWQSIVARNAERAKNL